MLRHIEAVRCPVALMAMTYLYRFDMAKQTLDFESSKGDLGGDYLIYSIKNGPKKQLSYATQASNGNLFGNL